MLIKCLDQNTIPSVKKFLAHTHVPFKKFHYECIITLNPKNSVCLGVKFLKLELNSYLVCEFQGKENVFIII
jgi:hypothetical protein